MPLLQKDSTPRRWFTYLSLLMAGMVLLGAGYLGYLGYFGGPVFTTVPATAKPAVAEQGIAAVILSGDMGFHTGMGPKIARRLASEGIPVIGVNSLTFFRVRRSPAENSRLLTEAIRRGLAKPHAHRVVLIGQSFGADMLQAGLSGVAPELRRKIAMVALVVPGDSIEYRASPAELLDLEQPDSPALPTARTLKWVPVLCIHGEHEKHSLCPLLTMPNVRRVALPGGHHLNGDVDQVHAVLAEAINAAVQARRNAKQGSMS